MRSRAVRLLVGAVALTLFQPAVYLTAAGQDPPALTVLALFWSTEDYPANVLNDAGIRESLLAPSDRPVDYFTEYLESDRFPEEQSSDALRDYLRHKYRGKHIDVVIALTDVALQFSLGHRAELFPDAAVVFYGSLAPDQSIRDEGRGLTGVLIADGFRATLELALALHPETERVFVVLQSPNLAQQEMTRTFLREFAPKIEMTFITDPSIDNMLARVKSISPRSVVLYVRHSREEPGKVMFASQVAALVAAASPVPVYGVADSYLGSGVVGGVMFSSRAVGVRLGEMTRQIAAGARGLDIPIETARAVPTFDWRQLQRWGIDQGRLPVASTILYRQVGIWDQYRPQIIGAIVVVGVQAALIVTLLFQRARRRRVETALLDSQQRYSLATTAGAVGVWDWNLVTNDIYVDPRLKAMLGFDDAEIHNRIDDWGSHVYADDVPAVMAQAQRCIDGEIEIYEVAHRMVHKDGSLRWFLARGSLVNGSGSPKRLVGTDTDITERKQAEELLRENQAILEASNQEIQDLAGRLIASQDVERARIARDLHDDFSQQVAGLSIELSGLKRRLSALPAAGELAAEVSGLQQRTVGLADNIRHLSHDLHPSVLQHAGLVAALAAHCAHLERQHPVQISFAAEGDFGSITADAALCLYRVAQEGLRNVMTHASAAHAEVRLLRIDGHGELIIADDGRGFDIAAGVSNGRGLGLVSINERVRLVGGTVSIVTELNKGTRVRVQVPTHGRSNGSPLIPAG